MAVLKNQRHEKFAQNLAKGMTADAAYEGAGFKANRGNATRLKANDNIQKRVDEIVAPVAEKTAVTIESMAAQFDQDREFARGLKQAAAATSASVAKARLYGLLSEKHIHSGTVEHVNLSEDEIDRRIAEIDAKARTRTPKEATLQ